MSPEEEIEIVRLYVEDGLEGAEIAKRVGRSKQTVFTVLKANRVQLRRHRGSGPPPEGDPVPGVREILMARYALRVQLEEIVYLTKRCEALEGEVRRLGGNPDNPMTIPVESPTLRAARYRTELRELSQPAGSRSRPNRDRQEAGQSRRS